VDIGFYALEVTYDGIVRSSVNIPCLEHNSDENSLVNLYLKIEIHNPL